jgi:hypothetical protein
MGKKRLVGGVSFFVYNYGWPMPEKNLWRYVTKKGSPK